MNIVLDNVTGVIHDKSPIAMCTGYKAKSLIMKKGDFEQLRLLSHSDPVKFDAVMMQLEGRFKSKPVCNKCNDKGVCSDQHDGGSVEFYCECELGEKLLEDYLIAHPEDR